MTRIAHNMYRVPSGVDDSRWAFISSNNSTISATVRSGSFVHCVCAASREALSRLAAAFSGSIVR